MQVSFDPFEIREIQTAMNIRIKYYEDRNEGDKAEYVRYIKGNLDMLLEANARYGPQEG